MGMRTAVKICCVALVFATLVNAKSFDKHALVIGIADYKTFPADQKLKYADRDAKRFSDFIKTTEGGGFKEGNIHVLINASATRLNIFKEINVLSKLVDSGDLVYIFFAGHGVLDETEAAFFMPVDAVLTDPNALG
jgi:Caspase domain